MKAVLIAMIFLFSVQTLASREKVFWSVDVASPEQSQTSITAVFEEKDDFGKMLRDALERSPVLKKTVSRLDPRANEWIGMYVSLKPTYACYPNSCSAYNDTRFNGKVDSSKDSIKVGSNGRRTAIEFVGTGFTRELHEALKQSESQHVKRGVSKGYVQVTDDEREGHFLNCSDHGRDGVSLCEIFFVNEPKTETEK